jgi:hypothetical protein
MNLETSHFMTNSLICDYSSTGMWRSVVWLEFINNFKESN